MEKSSEMIDESGNLVKSKVKIRKRFSEYYRISLNISLKPQALDDLKTGREEPSAANEN